METKTTKSCICVAIKVILEEPKQIEPIKSQKSCSCEPKQQQLKEEIKSTKSCSCITKPSVAVEPPKPMEPPKSIKILKSCSCKPMKVKKEDDLKHPAPEETKSEEVTPEETKNEEVTPEETKSSPDEIELEESSQKEVEKTPPEGSQPQEPANSLDQLKVLSTIGADTGDFEDLEKYKPTDVTTNPSLIFAAAKLPQYKSLIDKAAEYGIQNGSTLEEKAEAATKQLTILFGAEILKVIPGHVSIEVDVRDCFNTEKTVAYAVKLIELFSNEGVPQDRVFIKITATWEGIQAAKILEHENGIHCNLTLIFNLCQAIACAEAGVTVVSPFVGRILDWYVAHGEQKSFTAEDDPGVKSVTEIYNYFKKFEYETKVLGASFRNADEIKSLAGCDILTVPPKILAELQATMDEVTPQLSPENAKQSSIERINVTESVFRWMMNDDQMATDKLSEGIRKFAEDIVKLENMLKEIISNM